MFNVPNHEPLISCAKTGKAHSTIVTNTVIFFIVKRYKLCTKIQILIESFYLNIKSEIFHSFYSGIQKYYLSLQKKSDKMHFMNIYDKIKERRSILGITQQDLAGISGVGLRTIKEIETGRGNPSFSTLLKILDVLGMEMEIKIKRTID